MHQHPPVAVERDDAGGDVLHHPLADLLLAHQPLAGVGDLARHLVDRLDQQGQLELGRREVERGGAGGDPPGPLDELHQRPGEVARQPPADGHQQGEEGRRHQQPLAAELRELARPLLLLGEQRHGEEQPVVAGAAPGMRSGAYISR